MEVHHHKSLHPFCLHIYWLRRRRKRDGLAVSGVAEAEEIEVVQGEEGEAGTLGITSIEKNLLISGPTQFKPVLFKGQLYMNCSEIGKLIDTERLVIA